MTWRRPASRSLLALGALLLAGALALLVASWTLPAQGLEGLGRVVGAMVLAGAAGVPFAFSLLLGRETAMPRWMVLLAATGCLIALLPAIAFLTAGVQGSVAFGAVFLAAALGGLVLAAGVWRRPRAAA